MKLSDKIALGAIAFAMLLGLAIRLAVVAQAGFPLNDGGLFYTMIQDLESNGLALPAVTAYNGASIPFAYPPLAFYFYALLNMATHVSVLQLMQYGPVIVSSASIPAFYFLAQDVLGSKPQATLAAFAFALLPRAFEWSIMGGGVTRSFGMLFAILAMQQTYRLFGARDSRAALPIVVLSGLVVYTHPEAATHTAISAAVFYLWRDRSRRGLLRGLLVALGVIIMTLPWWASVISRHGLDPFAAAMAAARVDSYNVVVGLLALLRFEFADEPFLSILSLLGLVGIFVQLARREFLLPIWLVAMHTLEPRGGTLFMMISLAMCAGIALDEALLPALRRPLEPALMPSEHSTASPPEETGTWLPELLRGVPVRLFVGFVLVYSTAAAYTTGWTVVQQFTLSQRDLAAIAWARANTGLNSRFALVTQGLPLRDASSEWFPALSGRQSTATVFGFEWVRSVDFGRRIDEYRSLQACAPRGVDCLQTWSKEYGEPLEYVYVTSSAGGPSLPLTTSLSHSDDYETVYSSQGVSIFRQEK